MTTNKGAYIVILRNLNVIMALMSTNQLINECLEIK